MAEERDERKDHLWKAVADGDQRMQDIDAPGSPVGLDVGTSKIVAARRRGKSQEIQTANQLNAFIPVPYSKFTQRTLDQNQVAYLHEGDELVIYGSATEKFANM